MEEINVIYNFGALEINFLIGCSSILRSHPARTDNVRCLE